MCWIKNRLDQTNMTALKEPMMHCTIAAIIALVFKMPGNGGAEREDTA